jgi:hypothetical protein
VKLRRMSLAVAIFCAATLAPAAAATASVGFADLPQLVARHPLHGVLVQYDAQIAALRATQSVAGLRNPAEIANQNANALQAETSGAAARAGAIGTRHAAANRARERAAITQLVAAKAQGSGMAAYTTRLASETNANLRAYASAMTERSDRAYAARAQQFREKELTLAYDLARRNAGKRLTLQLKLNDLRLTAARRAGLQAQLAALSGEERQTVEAAQRSDAQLLAAYRSQLEGDAAAASSAMDEQLRSKAGANYTILQRVFNEAGNGLETLPSASQLVAFSRSYAAASDARGIALAMRGAAGDLAQRFRQDAAVDAQSQRDVAAQLRALEADRDALDRSIVTEIRAQALAVARGRGLASVDFVSTVPKGAIDLTQVVAARLTQDW